MNLVVVAAVLVVCRAAKLDRSYLPPSSADTAGGSPGSLRAPLIRSSVQGLEGSGLPTGSYTNSFGGVVVDAASPGTRASADGDISGLGGPRPSYGSTDSKVGDAAFRGSAGFRKPASFGSSGQTNGQHGHSEQSFPSNPQIDTHAGQFPSNEQGESGGNHDKVGEAGQSFQVFNENKSERPQAAKDRNSNILALNNDVDSERYSYGFETDNGIAVGENGVAVNGVQAEGGYSYHGDDGQVYKVTYTADEGGYRPHGDHLPTPPPIPDEILKSLEQNAKEEAAGLVDDGSYDAQKYNTDSDYTHDNGGNIQHNEAQLSQFGKRPESDATDSGTFINQNVQAFRKPASGQFGTGSDQENTNLAFNGQASQFNGGQYGGQASASQNPHSSFNGQSSQVNRKPSGQFGSGSETIFNGQSSQVNRKPGQFGLTGLQLNGQSSQVNDQSGTAQFGAGSQNSHGSFSGQSSHGNQFASGFASAPHSDGSKSHSSQSQSGHRESSGAEQTISQNIGNQFSSQPGQGDLGSQAHFSSQYSQQGLASAQFETQSPSSETQQSSSSQFGSRPTKPAFGQSAGSSAFNSQSAQPQFGSSFKPQGSEAFSGASLNKDQDNQDFGKPSPHIFSGQNFNRPSAGNFNSNKQTTLGADKGSAAGSSSNRYPQVSGQFGADYEYLPPGSSNGQLTPEKPQDSQRFNSNSQKPVEKKLTLDYTTQNGQKPGFASAFASTSQQPAFQSQPTKPLNSFNKQSQFNPNQYTQHATQFTHKTNQFPSHNPVQFNSNPQQTGSFAQAVPDFGTKPTLIPETELTTPLEPNETSASSQGSQYPSQTKPSFSTFDSKPVSNNQEQTQFDFQGNSAFGQQPTSQTLSPSAPTSFPQSTNSQFGSASTQSVFQASAGKRPVSSNDKPQFSQNSFSQIQQNQPSFNQGVDNSYYYNQPSKPFHASGARPQGTRFPSSPSDQSNGVASQNQFFNQHSSFQSSAPGSLAPVAPTSATQFGQTQGYNGITQAAISPFPSVPTPSQLGTTQNSQFASKPTFSQQTSFGNEAKPSKAPFNQQSGFSNQFQSSVSQQSKPTFSQSGSELASSSKPQLSQKPTLSGNQPQTQFGQSGQFEQTENTPVPSDGSSQQQTMSQQYQGTVYEYNKPAEIPPASTQTDSSSSQTIQTGVTSESKPSFSQSQGNQLSTQQDSKPLSQGSESGSKLDGQAYKPFGSISSNNQFGQNTQITHGSQNPQHTGSHFGSQTVKPFNVPATNIQFGQTTQSDKPAKPLSTSTDQFIQNAQQTHDISTSSQQNVQGSFKPFGTANQGIQSTFGTKPQFSTQTQFSQNTQSFESFGTSQPGHSSSQTQFNSEAIRNIASGQNSGYFYPGNPKPQFQTPDTTKDKFVQNSQSGSDQFNHNSKNPTNQFEHISQTSDSSSGSFNQQTPQSQLNSASKPQVGSQSTQFGQNTQAQFGQKTPSNPIQHFGQSIASSQAVASGQATASASASSSPQFKPFGSQNKYQFGQIGNPERQDQSGQGTQFGAQKPFGALNSNTEIAEASKPLFSSACCQGSKDSTPAQSANNPSPANFQGASFNAQNFAGKGEEFGGPRQPPRFDQTGYHY